MEKLRVKDTDRVEREGSRFLERFGTTTLSGRKRIQPERTAPDNPLLVAIHGGSYSSAYFDIPGYSLLDRAE